MGFRSLISHFFPICMLLTAAFLDFVLPASIAVGVIYILVVQAAILFRNYPSRWYVMMASLITAVMMVGIAYDIMVNKQDPMVSGVNHMLTCLVVWIVTLIGVRHKATEEELRNSEVLFRELCENLQEVFWMRCSRTHDLIYVSPSYEKIWGFSTSFMYRDPDSWSKAVHPDDRHKMSDEFLSQLREGKKAREYRIVRPDGQVRWILERGYPIRDSEGRIYRYGGIAEDISETVRKEQLLQEKRVAEAASKAKSYFLASASHEIRTPLTPIIGFTNMILATTPLDAESRKSMEVIRRNGKHLLALINDLLDLSKMEADELLVNREEMAPYDEIRAALDLFQERIIAKRLQAHIELASPIPARIISDHQRFRQIMMNLIGNAVKYTNRGSIVITCRQAPGGILEFLVTDTGIGIDPEEHDRIFQPFNRGPQNRCQRVEGAGLGLTLSQRLAHKLGGDVTLVTSQVAKGTTFLLTLPCETPPGCGYIDSQSMLEHEDPSTEVDWIKYVSQRISGAQVLLVEDCEDIRQLIECYLTLGGAITTACGDGGDAVRLASGGDFDTVLMDIQLPTKSGYAATRELRALGYSKPIIALTAHALQSELDRCIRSGCNDYLTKPVSPIALISAIQRVVAQNAPDTAVHH